MRVRRQRFNSTSTGLLPRSFRCIDWMSRAFCLALLLMYSTMIQAQTTVQLSSITERTGPKASLGIPFADGFKDYFQLLNLRDGGIGGAQIVVDECEAGSDATTFNECYAAASKRGTLAYSSWSAANAHALTVKTHADQIPFLSAGQGPSVAAVGQQFPWTFAYPLTPWSQLSAMLAYINTVSDLRNQTIGFLFPDTEYGNEPLALLEAFSKAFDFKIAQYPTRIEDVSDQSLQWFHVRKGQPDWIIIWDDGAMISTAIKQAINIRFPKDRLIGNALSGSTANLKSMGKKANGYLAVNYTAIGQDIPAIQQLLKQQLDAGSITAISRDQVGSVMYNRGVLSAVILAEAIAVAQTKAGTAQIERADLRYGLENFRLSKARLTTLGLTGFSSEITGSCTDHEGGGTVYIQQWDGSNWQQRSDEIEPMRAFARSKLQNAAAAFIAQNPGWVGQSCP